MSAYPATLASGRTWSSPLVRSLEFETRIMAGANGTEQRWPIHAGRESWQLTYTGIPSADVSTLAAFFDSMKGSFDGTFDFVFQTVTYPGCFLDVDQFSAVEKSGGKWDIALTVRQAKRAPDAGSLGSDFPALSTGAATQLPYTVGREFSTVSVQTEGGRFAWYNRGTVVQSWSAGGTSLTDAEADAIWSYFALARGRYAAFAFTDPESLVRYPSCRFAADTLERHYLSRNQNSIEAQIRQTV